MRAEDEQQAAQENQQLVDKPQNDQEEPLEKTTPVEVEVEPAAPLDKPVQVEKQPEPKPEQPKEKPRMKINGVAVSEAEQSVLMVDFSQIEAIRIGDPRFGDKHFSIKAQTKLQRDKI